MYLVDFLCVYLITTLISEYDSFEYNLTTATIRQSTSPKPSIFHREITVEIEMSNSSDVDSSVDARRKKRIKSKSFFWPWDSWCLLQPKEGRCGKMKERFYYNLQMDRCAKFTYSGCYGNENNFETFYECEKFCKGSSLMNIVENTSLPNFCVLQPDPGLCLALLQKYYYDINDQSCKRFTYGGCGGNQNKFDSIFSCMDNCKPVVSKEL